MMIGGFWLWMAFMFLFLFAPVGYGWGYRGWGAPYPRYLQRRRKSLAIGVAGTGAFDHEAWGRGGDFVWVILSLGIFWAVVAMFWR